MAAIPPFEHAPSSRETPRRPVWHELMPTVLDHLQSVAGADRAFVLRVGGARGGWWLHGWGAGGQVMMPADVLRHLRERSCVLHFWEADQREDERALLCALHADSVVLAPVFSREGLWGALGVATGSQDHVWCGRARDALRTMAVLCTAAVATGVVLPG